MPRIKKLIVEKVLTDKETKDFEGCFIDESYMKYPVIQSNIDVYYKDESGEEKLLLKYRKKALTDNEIRLRSIGSLENLPGKCQRELNEVVLKTAENKRMTLTLALSYGSKEEITGALKQIAKEVSGIHLYQLLRFIIFGKKTVE